MDYLTFLQAKQIFTQSFGIEPQSVNVKLFDWQRAVTQWALRKGRAALFEDCGLGKTAQQLAWAADLPLGADGWIGDFYKKD